MVNFKQKKLKIKRKLTIQDFFNRWSVLNKKSGQFYLTINNLVFSSRTAAAKYLDTIYSHKASSEGAIKKAIKGTPVGERSDWHGLAARYVTKESYQALLRLYPELNKEIA